MLIQVKLYTVSSNKEARDLIIDEDEKNEFNKALASILKSESTDE